jgi:LuxR family maltose regulon positive regulatory protein
LTQTWRAKPPASSRPASFLTREDPSLPLTSLRAYNQLTEIRAEELSFTREEAGQFFSEVMGLFLSEGDNSVLENRTEGKIDLLQQII